MLHARLDAAVDNVKDDLTLLAKSIHATPELRWEEHEACRLIAATLAKHGVAVESRTGGLDTAFRARTGGSGPRVAILAEYDALPDVGHACGHNLIAAGAVGAFLAANAAASDLGGEVVLIGTPAEEGGGGKVKLIEAGVFDGFDAAIMFHPFNHDILMHPALANLWMECVFTGKPSHAAAAPQEGRSALTACMDTFRLVDGQRVHFRDGVRVHGFIKEGGVAVNIIPERAVCELSIRATTVAERDRVRAIVERCARGAATASDVSVEITVRPGYRDMRNNEAMADRFGAHVRALGRTPHRTYPQMGAGSTDMGDVSHVVPSIHPYVAICGADETTIHQREFAAIAGGERGMEGMLLAAKAMARTAADVLSDAGFRGAVRGGFEG